MNIQTKHVRANFVPSGPVSYNQLIAKKYFKSQNQFKQLKKNQLLNTVENKNIDSVNFSLLALAILHFKDLQ